MKKHLTTLMALAAALVVPSAVMAQDAVSQVSASDIFGTSADPAAEAPAADNSKPEANAESPATPTVNDAPTTTVAAEPAATAAAETPVAAEAPVAAETTAAETAVAAESEPAPTAEASEDAIVADGNTKVDDSETVADNAKDEAKDEDEDKNWGVSAEIGFDLGLGAFTKHEYARKIRSRFSMKLLGYYTIPVIDVDVYATTGFSQWMSKAGGSNGQYEFRWSDSAIGFSRSIWEYKKDGFEVTFGADLSFTLPTSTASINTKLYTEIAPALSASLKFHKLSFSYQITYGNNFNKYTSVTLNPSEVDVLSRSAGNEIIGTHDIAIDGVLTEMELVNEFAIGYQFIKQFGMNIGFAFADAWTYDNGTITKDDEFVNPYAKVGRGHSQISVGSISLVYTPIKYASIVFSMVSKQPWKTADNKTLRFPWFDTVSPSKNYTKFILGAVFTY